MQKNGSSYSGATNVKNHAGYNDSLYFPHKNVWNEVYGYFIYESNTVYDVDFFGDIAGGRYNYAGRGCRPKLPANIYAMKGNDNKWTFKK